MTENVHYRITQGSSLPYFYEYQIESDPTFASKMNYLPELLTDTPDDAYSKKYRTVCDITKRRHVMHVIA